VNRKERKEHKVFRCFGLRGKGIDYDDDDDEEDEFGGRGRRTEGGGQRSAGQWGCVSVSPCFGGDGERLTQRARGGRKQKVESGNLRDEWDEVELVLTRSSRRLRASWAIAMQASQR